MGAADSIPYRQRIIIQYGGFTVKRILILLLSLGLVLAVVYGCSDDDGPTEPNDLQTGSLDDPEFQLAQEAFFDAEDFSDEMFDWMELFIDSIFFEAAQQSSSSSFTAKLLADTIWVTYHEDSEYWYLYFRHDDTTWDGDAVQEVTTTRLYDSMQFLHGDVPQQWPDSNLLTGIANGALLTVGTLTGLGSATATQDITITGAAGELAHEGDVVLAGTRTFALGIVGEGGQCTADLEASATATAIALNIAASEEGACPESGRLVHVATIALACTGDTTFSFSDTWRFDQTFYGDSIKVVVENSTTRWTFTDTCDVIVLAAPARPDSELIARLRER